MNTRTVILALALLCAGFVSSGKAATTFDFNFGTVLDANFGNGSITVSDGDGVKILPNGVIDFSADLGGYSFDLANDIVTPSVTVTGSSLGGTITAGQFTSINLGPPVATLSLNFNNSTFVLQTTSGMTLGTITQTGSTTTPAVPDSGATSGLLLGTLLLLGAAYRYRPKTASA